MFASAQHCLRMACVPLCVCVVRRPDLFRCILAFNGIRQMNGTWPQSDGVYSIFTVPPVVLHHPSLPLFYFSVFLELQGQLCESQEGGKLSRRPNGRSLDPKALFNDPAPGSRTQVPEVQVLTCICLPLRRAVEIQNCNLSLLRPTC